MLIMAGKARDFAEAEGLIKSVVADGSALAKFAEIIAAQGGNPRVIEDYSLFYTAKYQLPIPATQSGYIHAIDSRAIGYALVRIKAGRMKTADLLDYSSGAILYPKIGDQIRAGDEIGTLHCKDKAQGEEVLKMIREAYKICEAPKDKEALIYEIK
ncbi:MAG: hypothetical protein WCR98_07190, partial [Saccharofermentanales bacterium]